jgi:hypothetical protein
MSATTASAAAARLLARRVSQVLFASAPMHLLLIFYVLATERAATRGWGRPKIHSQVLTSYRWLPLRNTISKVEQTRDTYSTYEILAWLKLHYL